MIHLRNFSKIFCLFLLTVFLVFPNQAQALQSHAAPEGIYVHQLAHVFFLAALCYLFWDIRRSSFPSKGWRFLQLFCVFMIIWNIVAFTGHWIGGSIESSDIIYDSGYLTTRIAGPITTIKLLYYLTKLDHIFSVPAMFCLYLCLRSLYSATCKGEKQ
ncbi:MAG TPA: hypothetical protein EYP35_01950 [Desulfobacterales bacterium]|nr:hypothetical protein [Desulfobacterales bacterium]HIP38437.1 hypothetical protein [Desulfocapsa sulfexigens]